MKYKENSNYPAPIIVLVRPQMAENMGMVARAMMNCGLSELRIVCPRESHLSQSSLAASSGAQVILEQARIFDSLAEALKDVHYSFATTARSRDMEKRIFTPDKASQKINTLLKLKHKVAIVFGPERTGLENHDIILSNAILSIPLNPIHPSLNLAQAVLLVGWSWWQTELKVDHNKKSIASLATQKDLDCFLAFLDTQLQDKNYYQDLKKKHRMQYNLHNIFLRNELTLSEIKTLYRVIKTLSKKKNDIL